MVIPVSSPQPSANGTSPRSVEIRIARWPESGARRRAPVRRSIARRA